MCLARSNHGAAILLTRSATLVVALLASCAYPSAYVAPRDGRARAVWTGSDVAVELSGGPLGDACAAQLRAWSGQGVVHLVTGDLGGTRASHPWMTNAALGFWIPVYFGPALVPLAPGIPPPLLHPVIFFPPPVLAPPVLGTRPIVPSLRPAPDVGKAAVVLAVLALAVMPVVDVLLATLPPERERSSEAIDQVNVYNDLARSPNSPCAYPAGAP